MVKIAIYFRVLRNITKNKHSEKDNTTVFHSNIFKKSEPFKSRSQQIDNSAQLVCVTFDIGEVFLVLKDCT